MTRPAAKPAATTAPPFPQGGYAPNAAHDAAVREQKRRRLTAWLTTRPAFEGDVGMSYHQWVAGLCISRMAERDLDRARGASPKDLAELADRLADAMVERLVRKEIPET